MHPSSAKLYPPAFLSSSIPQATKTIKYYAVIISLTIFSRMTIIKLAVWDIVEVLQSIIFSELVIVRNKRKKNV